MKFTIPRLRVFAGPNGSGKSTIKDVINKELLGIYINPDEIEKEIKQYGFLNFDHYEIKTTKDEVVDFFNNSVLLKNVNLTEDIICLKFNNNKLIFTNIEINSYYASVCSDFIRKKLLELRKSFTFETVMSSYDKIELLKLSKELGYKNYLYFISTSDPLINISRVKHRVYNGGHNVSDEKIISRYYRTLENLRNAVKLTNRTYIFDNSSYKRNFICEVTNGKNIKFKQDNIPLWVNKYLLNIYGNKH